MNEEDREALVVYLRHIKPVWHKVPERSANNSGALYLFYPYDFAAHQKHK
jgi:hypothetical protein